MSVVRRRIGLRREYVHVMLASSAIAGCLGLACAPSAPARVARPTANECQFVEPEEPEADGSFQGRRRSGILMHVTSLPGPYPMGDLGPAAHGFVRFLQKSGQTLWQVLPTGPTRAPHESPFDALSAFAGSSLLLSPDALVADGLLDPEDLEPLPIVHPGVSDYERTRVFKWRLLRRAHDRFKRLPPSPDYVSFRREEAYWLDDYTLFMALRQAHGGTAWWRWPEPLRRRDPDALARARATLQDEVQLHEFAQFQFSRQWAALKRSANERGVLLVGDVPIYVGHDSADVWANQRLFQLDRDTGEARFVAGAPPDQFSADGQLWGNPVYDWAAHRARGFDWWFGRVRHALSRFDWFRVDHFRGFESYWAVPATARTARDGHWEPGPRHELFSVLERGLGRKLPVIVEDLGIITDAVRQLRDDLGYPGMRILQFAFGDNDTGYAPHHHVANTVVYTSTHDTDTLSGWFDAQAADYSETPALQLARERRRAVNYLGVTDARSAPWALLRSAQSSVADVVIVAMQDVLGLGSESRMNRPGAARGQWTWRLTDEQLERAPSDCLFALARRFDRIPPPSTDRRPELESSNRSPHVEVNGHRGASRRR